MEEWTLDCEREGGGAERGSRVRREEEKGEDGACVRELVVRLRAQVWQIAWWRGIVLWREFMVGTGTMKLCVSMLRC